MMTAPVHTVLYPGKSLRPRVVMVRPLRVLLDQIRRRNTAMMIATMTALPPNKRQAASAIKETKRCASAAINSGAEWGAVCTLKVDYQTHSHAQGLIGTVYNVT